MNVAAARLFGEGFSRGQRGLDDRHDVGEMAFDLAFDGDGVKPDGAEGGWPLPLATQARDQIKHRLVVEILQEWVIQSMTDVRSDEASPRRNSTEVRKG